MGSIIRVLDEQTINEIAAGEVIENPASVVKELIENSLDAGASQIVIEIAAGGRQLIKVIDNGCGMSEGDALLCFQRHATSKIQKTEDLNVVLTMGFRGEAIPSIAAVSKTTLMTANNDNMQGTLVIIEGGTLMHHGSTVHAKGTSIEIKNLFFNVPARKKFQKSIASDTAEVLKIVSVLALAYPHIQFQLLSNKKTLLTTQTSYAGNLNEKFYQRVQEVLGNVFSDRSIPLDYCEGGISIQGLIGSPEEHRNNRTGQYLFINQRAVASPLVSFAISDGYGTLLPPRRFPIYALHLSIPGTLVDVNVHPQKKEVRIRSSHSLRKMITEAIERTLVKSQEQHPFSIPSFLVAESTVECFTNEYNPPDYIRPHPLFSSLQEAIPTYNVELQDLNQQLADANEPETPTEQYGQFSQDWVLPKIVGIWSFYILLDAASLPSNHPFSEHHGGLIFLDQRKTHARILFEELLTKNHRIESQDLLIPIHLNFAYLEAHLLTHYLSELNQIGIGIRPFGERSFIIEALPASFPAADVEALMVDILSNLDHFSKDATVKKQKDIHTAMAASKAAISRKTSLTANDAEGLIKRLFTCKDPYHCPQGKAVMTLISHEELIKRFRN